MLTDLRLWAEARKFAEESGRVNVESLLLKQAMWCEEAGEVAAAATIYSGLGQTVKAVNLLGNRGLFPSLIELVRTLPSPRVESAASDADAAAAATTAAAAKDVRDALIAAGTFFRKAGLMSYAKEVFSRLDDTRALVQILIDAQQWSEALTLAHRADSERPVAARKAADSLAAVVHLAKGHYLAAADMFEEAQKEFELAGRADLSSEILRKLARNAVKEDRFADAAYFFYRLSVDSAGSAVAPGARLALFRRYQHLADVYHAYAVVHDYIASPFTTHAAETVFNAAVSVLNRSVGTAGRGTARSQKQGAPVLVPEGVSLMKSLYALVRQGILLEAFKVTRFALEQLASMHTAYQWQDALDLAALNVQSKPLADKEELTHICYRCSSPLPTVGCNAASFAVKSVVDTGEEHAHSLAGEGLNRDACPTCGHLVVRSSFTFEPLPLVEFSAEGMDAESAFATIRAGGSSSSVQDASRRGGAAADPFSVLLSRESANVSDGTFTIPAAALRSLAPSEVYLVHTRGGPSKSADGASGSKAVRMFKNIMPELPISMCASCCRFFHTEDLEFEVLKRGCCPFCRSPADHVWG
jgi:intraflagellar transport protein 122